MQAHLRAWARLKFILLSPEFMHVAVCVLAFFAKALMIKYS